ncbi:MAG: hypothetical protein JSS66_15485 [Armatimonadetes bacterium]|nr:hypothetical protein [Armatimonadota bacterium]
MKQTSLKTVIGAIVASTVLSIAYISCSSCEHVVKTGTGVLVQRADKVLRTIEAGSEPPPTGAKTSFKVDDLFSPAIVAKLSDDGKARTAEDRRSRLIRVVLAVMGLNEAVDTYVSFLHRMTEAHLRARQLGFRAPQAPAAMAEKLRLGVKYRSDAVERDVVMSRLGDLIKFEVTGTNDALEAVEIAEEVVKLDTVIQACAWILQCCPTDASASKHIVDAGLSEDLTDRARAFRLDGDRQSYDEIYAAVVRWAQVDTGSSDSSPPTKKTQVLRAPSRFESAAH